MLRGGRSYLWLMVLALVIAAASLAYPSSPSYDPFSWLIWGREIFHAITGTGSGDSALWIAGGTSWKPLPVIFTPVFALFGSAQPDLWLVVARAGAALTVLMSVKLTVRITWGLVSQGRGAALLREQAWGELAVIAAPVVFAAAAALICATFSPHFPGDMMLGYSEGVMTAAFLIATERAWDGHHRQAFAIGIIPSLDRPEVWPIWGLYGLWLMRRERGSWKLVIGLAILMLALWLVPQKLGAGSLSGLFTHPLANHSAKSAVNTSFPFWNELVHTLRPLVIERLEIASLLLIAYTTYLVIRARRQIGGWRAALERHPAAAAAALCGGFGFLWWLGISVETQIGFAGNPRYAVVGVMFVVVSGCAAYGWACLGIAALAARALRWLRGRMGTDRGSGSRQWVWLVGASTLVVLVVFAIVPRRFTSTMPTVSSIRASLSYQAHLRDEVGELIQRAGGAQNVVKCGSMMTHNLQVTMLAWELGVPIPWIQRLPGGLSTEPGPNVVFQDGPTSTFPGDQGPSNRQMRAWAQAWKQKNGSHYTVLKSTAVRLYMDCSTYSTT
jgi:hypothetical protein